jgi:hypothetical protein
MARMPRAHRPVSGSSFGKRQGLAVDDQVIGVAGEAIDGALSSDGIGEEGEPLIGPRLEVRMTLHANRDAPVSRTNKGFQGSKV